MTDKAMPFTFVDLFAGIGGIRIPFQQMGGRCVFTSEINEECQRAYEANFGERPTGDIDSLPTGRSAASTKSD